MRSPAWYLALVADGAFNLGPNFTAAVRQIIRSTEVMTVCLTFISLTGRAARLKRIGLEGLPVATLQIRTSACRCCRGS